LIISYGAEVVVVVGPAVVDVGGGGINSSIER